MKEKEESLEERLKALQKEAPTDPVEKEKLAKLYYNLAHAYGQLDKTEQQIECYEKSLELDPKQPQALRFLGFAYRRKKEYDKAIELFNKIIKLNPDDYGIYYYLSSIYEKKGMEEEAEKYQKIYEEMKKKQAEADIKRLKEEIRKKENAK